MGSCPDTEARHLRRSFRGTGNKQGAIRCSHNPARTHLTKLFDKIHTVFVVARDTHLSRQIVGTDK
ncbi:HpcH/HpaI aldolase [Colletotrichum scovillei]|uniref:HpcH/HpaI aldolase n=1 Tax=Colletotrichum scovillei TaxID=1209932 RepID=A0A9P7RAS9_9PEZI|nr:HpcH/HpaI aldolase [Colletotrichum scovillei]KAG7071078.1 HpcH/HpaI aldolase [Colletotrichum scovillei]